MPTTRREFATTAAAAATTFAAGRAEAQPGTAARPSATGGRRAARLVWFHMDSLLPDAPDRLPLESWLKVAAEGTRVSRMAVVFPYHPTDNGFFPLSTTSLPNPTAAAGSLFLRPAPEQDYMQRHFHGPRALIANSLAYRSLAEGCTHVVLSGGMSDAEVVEAGLRQLREAPDTSFLRLILQETNGVLQRVGFERGAAWHGDAYAAGSPYPDAVHRADALLGRFVAGLRAMGMEEDTLLMLMPEGAAPTGWHGPQQEAGWTMPFALRGRGVARGRVTGYGEHIDVAHTVAALMGIDGPRHDGASGRVLHELTAGSDGRGVDVPERMLRFNRQLKEHLRLTGWMQGHAERFPALELAWMASHNSYQLRSQFWGIGNIHEWPSAGGFDRMLQDNDRVLAYLRDALAASGVPPLPGA